MADRAEVRNAADPRQVKRAARKQERLEQERKARLHAVMSTVDGRAVMWDLLGKAGVYRSVFNPSGSQMYYLAGRQDFGHELLDELVTLSEDLYILMETEARARARREALETDAAHTPRADESTDSNERTEVDG